MTLEPHHRAGRTATVAERRAAVKAAAERHAQVLAAAGLDPGEAIIVGYGRAVGERHARICPDHSADRCVYRDRPVVDDGPALEAHRRELLERLRENEGRLQ